MTPNTKRNSPNVHSHAVWAMGGFPRSRFILICASQTFYNERTCREGDGKEKRTSGEGEGKQADGEMQGRSEDGKEGRGACAAPADGPRMLRGQAPCRHSPASQRAVPLRTWRLELGSSGREASQPGACILDSLSFTPLMSLCSPQALQSLGRLSSGSGFSGASEEQNDTCTGAMVLRVWRRGGPTFQSPSPAPAGKRLGSGCTSPPPS